MSNKVLSEKKKKLVEGLKQRADGKYYLTESITFDSSRYEKLPMTESIIKIDDKEYAPYGKFRFKIWDSNFNANGRNYKKVIEKTLRDKKVTLGFANHPDGENDVTKTFAVEKNPLKSGDWLCVDCYLVGEQGKLVRQILEAGGTIGVSSSAWGDLDDDGYVLSEGFELERYCDWVDDPSNGYMHTKDESEVRENRDKEEKLVQDEKKVNENVTTQKDTTIIKSDINSNKENKKMAELTKKDIREKMLLIDSFNRKIKQKETIKNPSEKLKEFKNLSEMFDEETERLIPSIQENINKRISELEEEVKEYSFKGLETDELKEKVVTLESEMIEIIKENNELKEQVKDLALLADDTKRVLNTTKTIYEKKSKETKEMIELSRYTKLAKLIESLEDKIDYLQDFEDKYYDLKESIREEKRKAKLNEVRKQREIENKRRDLRVQRQHELLEKQRLSEKQKRLDRIKYRRENYDLSETFEIEDWINDVSKNDKSILPLQEKLLRCGTLNKAMKVFEDYKIENTVTEEDILQERINKIKDVKGATFQELINRGSKTDMNYSFDVNMEGLDYDNLD